MEGGGKSTQPLQFSFTFYDLDGHHGKITKDVSASFVHSEQPQSYLFTRSLIIATISIDLQDIAGIVYTIYESIGKSVVVPHCGSKTINVRLTVSPDAKKPAKKQRLKTKRLFKGDEEECGSSNAINETSNVVAKSQMTENAQPQKHDRITTPGNYQS